MALPQGWASETVDTLFTVIGGGTPSTKNAEYWGEAGTPWFSSADISDDGKISTRRFVTEAGLANSTTNVVPKDSIIVVTRVGLGKVAFLKEAMCFSQDNQALLPRYADALVNKYVFYCLHNSMQTLKYSGRGTTISGITKKQLTDCAFPLPPLAEQHRIVAKIDALFSELDKGVEVLQTVRQQLRTYRQAVLKWAFEGIETFTKLGDLYSMSPQNGLYVPATAYGSGIPILRIDGFYDGRISYDYKFKRVEIEQGVTESYALLIGDLVINRVNSMPYLGKCALVTSLYEPTVFESNMMRLRLDTALCDLRYVTYFLCSEKGKQELKKNAKQAVNQASINQKDVANVDIPIPKKSTQTEIVSAIESRLSVCDKLEQLIDENLAKAQSLRQSILKKAFTGELVPQDPNDEPAEKLLERIKAAKATTATKTTSARRKRK